MCVSSCDEVIDQNKLSPLWQLAKNNSPSFPFPKKYLSILSLALETIRYSGRQQKNSQIRHSVFRHLVTESMKAP
jgi:hypothetical protein